MTADTASSGVDHGPAVVIINAVLTLITSVVVGLRFWSRKLTGAGWRLDDWLVLASLFCACGLLIASCLAVRYGGLGRNQATVEADDPYAVTAFLQILYIAEYGYGTASPLAKLSVLAFYRRVFPTPTVKQGVNWIGAMCIGWWIAIMLTNILQCRPISAFWDPSIDAICIDLILYFAGNSVANCIIDLFTLILPIKEVMRLHVSQYKKAGLCGVFALGSIVVIASMVRTGSLFALWTTGVTDITEQYTLMWVATCVEIYVAIIGCCLPTLVPSYRQLRYGRPDGSSVGQSGNKSYVHMTPHGSSHLNSNRNPIARRSHGRQLEEGEFELLDKQ